MYALGILRGRQGGEISDSINFYQQSPTDKFLNDFVGKVGSKSFIVEFKRNVDTIKKELEKEHKKEIIKELRKDKTLEDLSRQCHYLGFGIENKDQTASILFNGYFNKLPAPYDRKGIATLETFLNSIVDGKRGLEHEDFIKYFNFLVKYAGSTNLEAVVVNVSSSGGIRFVKVNSLEMLLVKELSLSRSQSIEIKRNDDFTISP